MVPQDADEVVARRQRARAEALLGALDGKLAFGTMNRGGLAGAAVSLFLPETADTDLPDTVVAAEEFGKGQPSKVLGPLFDRLFG